MREILAIMDVLGGFAMVALMQQITFGWGWRTVDERWAMVRRIIYAAVAFALFEKGVYRIEHSDPIPIEDGGAQLVILIALILFPLLRALKVITQDHWSPRSRPSINPDL